MTVIEGEVVVDNAPAILPPSKDEKVQELARLSPEQQVEQVTEMLVHSHAGLLVAIAAQDLPGIAVAKQRAATIQEIAKQVRMGKDMQLNAAEFCRRAERGLGVAIREGQANGTVETTSEGKSRGPAIRDHRVDSVMIKPKPSDFANATELSGNNSGIYHLTDGVNERQFEEALAEAKAEGNLSRANVARKAKAKAQESVVDPSLEPDIDAEIQPKPAMAPTGPRPFKKSDTEMLAEIVGSLANFADLMRYIQPDNIAKDDAIRLADQAGSAIGLIRKSFKEIRNGKA